jgi:hypothetical protein
MLFIFNTYQEGNTALSKAYKARNKDLIMLLIQEKRCDGVLRQLPEVR